MPFTNNYTADDYLKASDQYKARFQKVQELALRAGLDKKFSLTTQEIAIQYLIKKPDLESDAEVVELLNSTILPPYSKALLRLKKNIEEQYTESKIGKLLPLTLEEVMDVVLDKARSGNLDDLQTDTDFGKSLQATIIEGIVVKKYGVQPLESDGAYNSIVNFLIAVAPYVRLVLQTEKIVS